MENIEVKLLSSLVKVFSDETPIQNTVKRLSALRNEKISFQLAYRCNADCNVEMSVKSDLHDALRLYEVKEINSCSGAYPKQDDYTLRRDASDYPDLLVPRNGNIKAVGGKWQSVWIEIASDELLAVGEHVIEFELSTADCVKVRAAIVVEIIDAVLPQQDLIYTNWFHTDCLANYYGVDVFSEEYWKITENYLALAAEYGMNAVLTPLFTPPLDTKVGGERPTVQLVDVYKNKSGYEFGFDKLRRWIEMSDRAGVKYFEMSHLFTQWGAKHAPKIIAECGGVKKKIFGWSTRAAGKKYGEFIDAFADELKTFIKTLGIENRCIFHVSDEPAKKFLRHYKKASDVVNRNFGEFPIIDALSDYDFYSNGLIKLPIPSNDHIEPFIGNVPELWTYYCCAQHTKYVANRFFNMPSQRNRVLGYQMYKYGVKGFLHWGYNYWYTRFSVKAVDPYKITDAGGAFSAGDSFVVYPSKDGKPLSSLRLKVFYDALQDMRALRLLESLTDRAEALSIIDSECEITFSQYPHSDDWQLETREKINRTIKNAIENKNAK